MIVDSSALMAVLFAEEDATVFARALAASSVNRMSSATYLETAILTDRGGGVGAAAYLEELLLETSIMIVPFTLEQARVAREAYARFGRGAHPAALNFGDCFTYALAKTLGEPVLFKGGDFSRTDIAIIDPAPYRSPLK